MPCDSRIVGRKIGPFEYDVDQFWTMGHAAGIGDLNPRFLDSLRFERLMAHPVFPVCLATRARWQMEPMFLEAGLTHEESIRSVHLTQDMILHRAIRPPEKLIVTATVAAMERRKSGTYLLTSYEISDTHGEPVATVHWGRLWRDVGMTGPDRRLDGIPEPPQIAGSDEVRTGGEMRIPIAATAAIVYTACARADNPVNFHTDSASAQRSKLPRPILMGVATLAMSVSRIVDGAAAQDAGRVARIYARFGAMVFMPSEVMLRVKQPKQSSLGDTIGFELLNAEGAQAIRDGVVILRNRPED